MRVTNLQCEDAAASNLALSLTSDALLKISAWIWRRSAYPMPSEHVVVLERASQLMTEISRWR